MPWLGQDYGHGRGRGLHRVAVGVSLHHPLRTSGIRPTFQDYTISFGRCTEGVQPPGVREAHRHLHSGGSSAPPLHAVLRCVHSGQPNRAANMEIWTPLSDIMYEAGTSRESHLRDPLHRLMHCIVSTSIMQREGGEKVSGEDMTFLWALLDQSRFLHLPFALAVALSTHSTGASTSSPLARGYFITRLARSYGILTAQVAASLTALPPSRTTACTLERMRLMSSSARGSSSGHRPSLLRHPSPRTPSQAGDAGGQSQHQQPRQSRSHSRRIWQPWLPGSRTSWHGSGRYSWIWPLSRAGPLDHSQPGPTITSPRSRGWTLQATW
ncbi:hypothetical protein L2E82_45712 [Cichorium intybus]|uniref:Uncharacterized protein n=1 Tax=Cichorium intybus TaxID=13427 RepID=A0ACB8ZSV2_CICIN|nr:hypothetical protein L2E82_45712 [Cichorium intybus]